MNRRDFLSVSAAALASPAFAADTAARPRLTMPPLLDTRRKGRLSLTARTGHSNFLGRAATPTAGFNQGYLGPTIRMQNGPLAVDILNALQETVSVHWHGMLVPGIHDGGPHSPIAPGARWTPDMQIGQPPATLWYHSHVHGRTAPHVYWGLAGVIHLTDGRDDRRGLPSDYGIDDLTLIIQDRRFDGTGRMVYAPSMTDVLNGFQGDRILINGQSGAAAAVPRGIARLRLLNASNARIYTLSFSDRRPLHLIGTDGGFLGKPAAMQYLRIAPGERAEVLADFSDGAAPILENSRGLPTAVLRFAVDERMPVRFTRVPDTLDEFSADGLLGGVVGTRRLSLTMGGGSGGHAMDHSMAGMAAHEGMSGHAVRDFGISGRPFDMGRVDAKLSLGTVERWVIGGGGAVEHPFHVHGVQFRVLGEAGGAAPSAMNSGWKDVVLITGETEIIARFDHPADPTHPFMYHCHILEHEDAGMMAQFTVT